MHIKLVRHGLSQANTGELDPQEVGDHRIPLAEMGRQQARNVGGVIGREFLDGAIIYTSPYLRARETLMGLFDGAGLPTDPANMPKVYEDPRLREVDHGYGDVSKQQILRERHGWFYYRYAGGESPADCYDRTSGFLEGMMRHIGRSQALRVLIVTHGLTIRCFIMRFLHLSVADFERIENPHNCDVITLAHREQLPEPPQFTWGDWGIHGLRIHGC